MSAAEIEAELGAIADPERATHSQRYFKTGPGEYGEGDVFLGVGLTGIRAVARRHRDAAPADVERLLASEFHEHRQCGLIILTLQAKRADEGERARIARFYLDHLDAVDNWDLVDVSAPVVLADEVRFRPRELLDPLLASERLWDRRVAVLATFSLIREGSFEEALNCCERLLGDREDLIHKATGWMHREVGKRDQSALERFLDRHVAEMPRTMLRYAIERLPPERRAHYMAR